MTPSSFAAFFRALWGNDRSPFDWQERLLERVANQGWPSTLDLPTGAGKTAALDIAVFALALDAARSATDRRQSRRIALVVDRRVVVDQAFERACLIAEKLHEAETGILAEVAAALRELSGDPDSLPVLPAILRGGMPREAEWARSPSQPVILTSTVDQIGSRLLFRGYGVSDRMRSVHAGLLGCDTLLLLDEVHLSRPFEETLTAITQLYGKGRSDRLTRPLQFVRMSATVASRTDDTLGLSPLDRESSRLSARLEAKKTALLRQVGTPRDPSKAADALAKAAVREVERLSSGKARALAVIVNRVETAKRIASLAQESLASGWTVSLLTGRMRPLDRLDKQAAVLEYVKSDRERNDRSPRLLLVSTQAIEAGADFDFDALVTECASLDALRQRFGRLDRMGDLRVTEAVILAGSSSIDDKAEADPIYGRALRETWRFLSSAAVPSSEFDAPTVDFGIDAMSHLLEGTSDEQKGTLVAPRAVAPVLTSSHLDRWVQTSRAPHADPEVAPFLHGIGRGVAEVQVVWRADITPEHLTPSLRPKLQVIFDLVRPSALEALSVPLWAAKQWLGRVRARSEQREANPDQIAAVLADVEGTEDQESEETRTASALIWDGGRISLADGPDDLRPGITIVVPSSYGGIDARFACWDTESTTPVTDRGDEAQLLQKGRAVLRWHPDVIQGWAASTDSNAVRHGPQVKDVDVEERGARAEGDAFREWSAWAYSEGNPPEWVKVALRQLGSGKSTTERVELTQTSEDSGGYNWRAQIKMTRVPPAELRKLLRMPELRRAPSVDGLTEPATEEDEGSFLGSPISLNVHLRDVGRLAARFTHALSLPRELTEDLALSGCLHDLGKADPRFQLMLHGGDAVREAAAKELLAKSPIAASDREARERAQERSRYPRGMRHELMSVALVEREGSIRARAHDWDLVLHLVASHHGWCRPFAPPVVDQDSQLVSVEFQGTKLTSLSAHDLQRFDSAVPERFWKLVRHYGYWGLAWLEAALRLADHRASEQEAPQEDPSDK